jgi:hypothetical protein
MSRHGMTGYDQRETQCLVVISNQGVITNDPRSSFFESIITMFNEHGLFTTLAPSWRNNLPKLKKYDKEILITIFPH